MSYNQNNTTATPAVPLNTTLEDKPLISNNNTYNDSPTNKIIFIFFYIIYIIMTIYTFILFRYAHYRRSRNNNFDLISIDSGYFENFHEDEQEENVD
ncbi:hypothetical protein PGAL8A_00178800 [Plasmodium gallinaceum]|uniref:Uncharacterized protein n=1 Tax=Plasmodium gallinaceum TaxID=5849 RepID=A0A1J1GP55_PLAGA|nr:hypothetical protein PGAL8A_00178800 [Plasmodium gallinaceum]CRG94076.1 hypothetical protein PGAL8A_00178800 [Plasmodium gallinaceum]